MQKNCFMDRFYPKTGFTLIELLVVVLIVGVLAAVALPQYNKAVKKAQGTEALTVINALEKTAARYYLENDCYDKKKTDYPAGAGWTDSSGDAFTEIPPMKYWEYFLYDHSSAWHSKSQFIGSIRGGSRSVGSLSRQTI